MGGLSLQQWCQSWRGHRRAWRNKRSEKHEGIGGDAIQRDADNLIFADRDALTLGRSIEAELLVVSPAPSDPWCRREALRSRGACQADIAERIVAGEFSEPLTTAS